MRAGEGRRRFIPAAPTRPAGGQPGPARPDIRIFPPGIPARAGYIFLARPAGSRRRCGRGCGAGGARIVGAGGDGVEAVEGDGGAGEEQAHEGEPDLV